LDTTTTLGSVLALVGVLAGAVVAYLGKKGETAVTGYSALTGDLQEERDRLDRLLVERDAKLAEQAALRAADQAEIARLRAIIIQLGGTP
jgi:hypothetical protein